MVFLFGEVSAGGDVSKILTGAAVGIATGGLGYLAGPAGLGIAAVSAEEAITAGVIAGAATAAGADVKVGVGCDGNGNNAHVETSFKNKEGKEFTFRTGEWNKDKPNPQESTEERIKREFEARKKYEEEHRFKEEKFDTDSIGDIEDFVFGRQEGRSYSRFTSEKESYDCMMDGDQIFLSTSGSRGFTVIPYKGFDSFSTFTSDTEDGREALKSFIFEETPLVWHFDRRNINGKWFNHAWTDANEDYLIPEGQEFYITAPKWYTEKRHAEAKARQDAEAQAKINEDVGRGFFEEFLWANVKAVISINKNNPEAGRDAINQGLSYYEYAMNAWNDPSLNCFSDSGMESIREFGASRISDHQYLDGLWEDLLSVGLNVAAGAVSGMEGGPAGMATGAAYGGLRAGVQIGVRRLKSEALSRLYKLFESQPKYAYAGAGNSNFKNFANFRKPANNASRNAKGSGGSGSQGPSVKEAGKGKERFSCTPDEQLSFIKKKLSDGSWMKTKHKIGGKPAYYSKEKDLWYTAVKREKNDIEVWKVSGKKAKHQGAMECKKGTMYEGPRHKDQLFE